MNEELGLPELKKLLADALREISMLKNQISIGINPSDIQDQPLDRIQGDSEDEEDAASNELYPIRIAELEEQLENERIRSDKLATAHVIRISALAEKSKNKILEGELLALKLTVTELEEKLLEVSHRGNYN